MSKQEAHLKRGENGERDNQGRFLPGWSGGPGRPARAVEESYAEAFRRAVTPEDLAKIASKLRDRALEGDVPAARLILDRTAPAEQIVNQRIEEVAKQADGEWEDWGLERVPDEVLGRVFRGGARIRDLDISLLDEKTK